MADSHWNEWIERARAASGCRELLNVRKEACAASAETEADGIEAEVDGLNRLHDAVIRRVCTLCEREMAALGYGLPPLPFSVILFGSGGRAEQTLWSDQDNGLLIDCPDETLRGEHDAYFREYGRLLVRRLVEAGYPPCEGKVTSDNPDWRKTAAGWQRQLDHWLAAVDWESVRHLLILFDMRVIHGDEAPARRLRERLLERAGDGERVEALLHNTLHHKITVNAFGQPLRVRHGDDAGGVEVKYGAYLPLVNGIRLLALRQGCAAHSTLERLDAVAASELVDAGTRDEWKSAVLSALKLRLLTRIIERDGGLRSGGAIPRERIDPALVEELKRCLKAGARLQKMLPKLAAEAGGLP